MKKLSALLAVLLLLCHAVTAQKHTTRGKVTDEKGNPVPFASLKVKDKSQGVTADADGNFEINVSPGTVLVVSIVGYTNKEVTASTERMNIALTRSDMSLSEVVVTTAFGVKKDQRNTPFSAQVITSEQLNIVPQTNINDALAGKIAGVQFRSQSGAKLNSQSFARIRGGLLLNGDVGAIFVVNGTIVNDAYDIDPNDVENITVLKGANATALFGSRATNGAIVITTRRARNGESKITFGQSMEFERVYRQPKLQNVYGGGGADYFTTYHWKTGDPEEWKALEGKAFPDYTDDASWGPKFEGQEYAPWYAWVPGTKYSGKTAKWLPQPDNIKDFWNTGFLNKTDLTFTKGGQGYNTKLTYSKEYHTGVIPNSKTDRNIISFNGNIEVNRFISAGIDLTYNTLNIYGDYSDGYANATSGNFGQWNHRDLDMKIMKELRGLKTPIGTLATWNWASNPDGYSASNPKGFYSANYWYNFYAYQDNLDQRQRRDRLYGNAYVKFKLNSDFNITGTVRKDQYNYYYENKTKSILEQSQTQTGVKASYNTGEYFRTEYNYELIASYNKTFLKDFHINALGGGNVFTAIVKSNSAATSQGLIIPDLYAINNSKSQPSIGNGRSEQKVNSLFISGDLDYKRFISATWAFRRDWSSTLPKGDNGLSYPSAGLAFIPSEFTKTALPWLSFAKVYGSWGNKPLTLDPYSLNATYGLNQYQWNGNFLLSAPDNVPDPNLKGSLITSYEAGIELRFFKNRFGLNFNYYNESAKNQPVSINVDNVSGYSSKTINAATVQRQGIEATLNAQLVSTRNVTWTVSKTFGWLIKNPVTKIVEGQDRIQISGSAFTSTYPRAYQERNKDWMQLIGSAMTKNADGKPLINPNTGLYVTGDQNYHWGSTVPKITGGLQSMFSYKNFTLNMSLDYQFGGRFFSLTESWGMFSGLLDYTAASNDKGKNVRDAVADGGGVHVVGVSSVDGKTPVDTYVDGFTYFHQFYSNKIADPFVHKLSFVKLRELSLGYNLPVKKWGLTNNWIQGASISVVAHSPWLIYSDTKNFDPSEISDLFGENGQLPALRSIGFNLKLIF